MAFRFETANERWNDYKQSVMEHPQYVPGIGTYIDGNKPGNMESLDNARTMLPAEQQYALGQTWTDGVNNYEYGVDFITTKSGYKVKDQQGNWVPANLETLRRVAADYEVRPGVHEPDAHGSGEASEQFADIQGRLIQLAQTPQLPAELMAGLEQLVSELEEVVAKDSSSANWYAG